MRKLLKWTINLIILPISVLIWLVYRAYLLATAIERKLQAIERGIK